ncbi:MAG: roadblock/LC7 domain-containing protein [Methanomicrobiaceae archaeon]|nr:roadblock/LC7 domain-containing protein [Methanomicrobiaceae archaeon]
MNASLPAGERVASMQVSLDKLFEFSPGFTGCVVIELDNTNGFVLVDGGRPVAAAYAAGNLRLSGRPAYDTILNKESLTCVLNKYTGDELDEAKILVQESFGFDIDESSGDQEEEGSSDDVLSPQTLENVLKQPGVKAVSVFFEGFALQSAGDADFEQVAALSEDFVRAANQITADLDMETATQLILETPQGKMIISPVGDLFICVVAENDSQLGLIRLAIQTIKHDLGEA